VGFLFRENRSDYFGFFLLSTDPRIPVVSERRQSRELDWLGRPFSPFSSLDGRRLDSTPDDPSGPFFFNWEQSRAHLFVRAGAVQCGCVEEVPVCVRCS